MPTASQVVDDAPVLDIFQASLKLCQFCNLFLTGFVNKWVFSVPEDLVDVPLPQTVKELFEVVSRFPHEQASGSVCEQIAEVIVRQVTAHFIGVPIERIVDARIPPTTEEIAKVSRKKRSDSRRP